MSDTTDTTQPFVHWFRQSSPYIHAFRGRTFVLAFDGAAVADPDFPALIHDIALLNSLGIRLVLVHGARPQIEQRLSERKARIDYVNGLRVTDDIALACVKQAVGSVRVEIEAQLSMGVANSPMAGARIRVASGNYVTAQPLGVRDGIDYCHTGEVRRIDAEAIQQRLDDGAIVLASPLGYSPTGETFNLTANEVATAIAVALQADKLLFLAEGDGIHDTEHHLMRELSTEQAQQLLTRRQTSVDELNHLHHAVQACQRGVARTHLIDRRIDGCMLQELFTRDGIGTLITSGPFEETRRANIDDVGGILNLIRPLEESGVLVRRSREQLELEIDHFIVVERDGTVIACAALYPYAGEHVAELACMAVHPDYRKANRGGELLAYTEKAARERRIQRIFVLTTQTAHWFQERGYQAGDIDDLPVQRKLLYNYQRRSKVFIKRLEA